MTTVTPPAGLPAVPAGVAPVPARPTRRGYSRRRHATEAWNSLAIGLGAG